MQCRGMAQSSADLRQIAARTLAHCEQNARSFGEGRRDHDVSQNIAALLKHLEVTAPFDLLDFGCGPGRDLRTFKEMGHGVVGLEGAPSSAVPARAHSGCELLEQRFLQLDLPARRRTEGLERRALWRVSRARASRRCSKPGQSPMA